MQIGNAEQTKIWGGFRVAKRAEIVSLNESDNVVEASHDGYKKMDVFHTRKFSSGNNKIIASLSTAALINLSINS